MILFFSLILFLYILLSAVLYWYWLKTPQYVFNPSLCETYISVIVSVRNEAENISFLIEDLNRQSYDKNLFELIVVNDYSEDQTASLVESYIGRVHFPLKLMNNQGQPGKKSSLETGINASHGTLVVTTDGDCRVGPNWLLTIVRFYEEYKPKMIIGGVSFTEEKSFWNRIQILEFASLIGSSAATLKMGFPTMCNGANLAYEKKVFYEVGGFKEFEMVPSGDDEFLMHKIFRKYPREVMFLKNNDASVLTAANKTLKDFIHQRRRWASKWDKYIFSHIRWLAFFIFFFNISFIVVFFCCLIGTYPADIFLILVLLKILVEFLFLRSVLLYFGKKLDIMAFLVTELSYSFYVSFVALISRTGRYRWKGREIKND